MTPLEFLYYIGYSLDKRYKLKRQKRLPHKVISIGNITVGGTGKTPATIAVAEEARKRGFNPVILTRGYKGKAKGPCLVQKSEVRSQKSEEKNFHASALPHFCSSALEAGDEPVLMAERLKDVPIVKCDDRYEGGMFFLRNHELSTMSHEPIFILDDGFQHRQLYRDVDIVLIDGINTFGNRKMLPVGPLREPLKELKRSNIFVITKTKNESLSDELKKINPSAHVYFSGYRMIKAKDVNGNEFPLEIFKNRKVYAFCGIANPESFKQTISTISGELCGFKIYRDHYRYTEKDINYLDDQSKTLNGDFLVTTEKDMVKIKEIQNSKFKIQINNILCLEIEFSIEEGFFDTVFKNIS